MANTDSHYFDITDAATYGVHEAIFLQNVTHWAKKNKANERNHHEVDSELYPHLAGQKRYFTFNSIRAFQELFPYMTTEKIRSVIKNLCDAGVLIKGNYNKSTYDRTIWYALSDEKCIGVNDQMHLLSSPNGFVPQPKPIPDINTNVNTDKDIVVLTISLLNEKSNSAFSSKSKKTISLVKARESEGFKQDDFDTVVKFKCSQWLGDQKMAAYLRPETLFGTKFEGYLNEAKRAAAKPKTAQELKEEKIAEIAAGSEFNQK